jgi:hypothetical protein
MYYFFILFFVFGFTVQAVEQTSTHKTLKQMIQKFLRSKKSQTPSDSTGTPVRVVLIIAGTGSVSSVLPSLGDTDSGRVTSTPLLNGSNNFIYSGVC